MKLTHQQLKILQLAADGMSEKEMAAELFLSKKTVQTHRYNIKNKIGARCMPHAVAIGMRKGWIV